MDIFERLMKLDRRWIFLLLIVVCVIGYKAHFQVPVIVEDEVRSVYDFIDSLPEGDVVLIAIDYDPQALAELHPMTYAIAEHCFRKKVKIIFTALSQYGPGMADQAIRDLTDSVMQDRTYNGVFFPGRKIVNGVDYTFLGYKPYYGLVILGMGQDFRLQFPNDYYGTPLDSLPMMRGLHNYNDIAGVIDISAGTITDAWISYGQGRFGFPLALGLTGVSAAQYYPYLNSGQIFGLMGGMTGAAQYEKLADNPGPARDAMRMQVAAHLVIILFIAMGNIGFFARRKRMKRQAGGQ
ncbi:MAG: hypothetical protein D6800_07640 [Candidatus Zixiibacteriota bacterium]|nr:MAG: hypothetical protein D6800_07640 [candidate division Zixibacteria bacterium]